MSTPALQGLKQQWPGVHIAAIHSGTSLPPWLIDHPLVDEPILDYRPKKISGLDGIPKLVRTLKAGNFDAAIMLQSRTRYIWAFRMAGIPIRVGSSDAVVKGLLTLNIAENRDVPDRHEVEYNFELMRHLQVTGGPGRMVLQQTSADNARAAELLNPISSHKGPVVALTATHGGSSRRLPRSVFVSAAREIAQVRNAKILIIGSEADADYNQAIADELGANGLNLTGKTNIATLGAVLKYATLHLSIDTGTSHAAAAVGTPCVTIFPASDHWDQRIRWVPWMVPTRILGPQSRCAGCKLFECNRKSEACIASITSDDVTRATFSLLDELSLIAEQAPSASEPGTALPG
jgi:ADP-heptose:LPS heptosyltransferase